MKCKKCGFELDPTDEFCRHCGQRTIEDSNMTVCPHCGEVISKLMVFCPNCHNIVSNKNNTSKPQINNNIIKCPNCGTENNANDTYCSKCLSWLGQTKNVSQKKTAKNIFKNPVFWVVSIIVVLFIIFIGVSNYKNNVIYNDASLNELTYKYNAEWLRTEYSDRCEYEDGDDNMMIVSAVAFSSRYADWDDIYDVLDEYEDEFNVVLDLDAYYEPSNQLNDIEYHNYKSDEDDGICEYDLYFYIQKNTLYYFVFQNSSHNKNFDEMKNYIIDNISFDKNDFYVATTAPELYDDYDYDYYDDYDYDYYEDETEEPTTEPPTEKPTEAPKPKINNDTSTGGFKAQGSGDYVATGLIVEGYGVLHVSYNGTGNFSIVSYENDEYDDLLVNNIGSYSGDVLIDHSGTFSIEINADEGNWNITSSGLTVDDTTSFSGSGDAVTGITSHSGGAWHITNNGSSNFSVIQYGLDSGYMDLLVNEIGNYDGTVMSESGDNIFFKVHSNGNWSIKKK